MPAVILQYGSYRHADGEVSVTIDYGVKETQAGVPFEIEHVWSVEGQVQADTPALVTAAYRALEAAYSSWFRDLILYRNDGGVAHALPNAGSTTGVKIAGFGYPSGQGAEGTTFRNYRFTARATYPYGPGVAAGGGGGLLKSFSETVATWGGGPRRVASELVNGPPRIHVLSPATAAYASQTGTAVGYAGYPPIPPPVYPAAFLADLPRVERTSPRNQNGFLTDWQVSWAYQFVSPGPFLAKFPTVWPAG